MDSIHDKFNEKFENESLGFMWVDEWMNVTYNTIMTVG